MLVLAFATLLLAASDAAPALRLTTMGDAPWQKLVPEATRGPEVATVHAGATLSQTLLRLPKGTLLASGRHEVDATLVLLEGELTVEAEGKTLALKPGAVLEIPAGTVYRGRTKWDRPALALLTLPAPWSRRAE